MLSFSLHDRLHQGIRLKAISSCPCRMCCLPPDSLSRVACVIGTKHNCLVPMARRTATHPGPKSAHTRTPAAAPSAPPCSRTHRASLRGSTIVRCSLASPQTYRAQSVSAAPAVYATIPIAVGSTRQPANMSAFRSVAWAPWNHGYQELVSRTAGGVGPPGG